MSTPSRLACALAWTAACGPAAPGEGSDSGPGATISGAPGTTEVTTSGESPTGPTTTSPTTGDGPPDCDAVCDAPWTFEGHLSITPLLDPAQFECMREVTGNLELTGFTGPLPAQLRALQRVGGFMVVFANDGLVDLAGLECLRRSEALFLEENPALVDVGALAGMETTTALAVHFCDALVDLSPLASLAGVRQLSLRSDLLLATLPALPVGTTLDRLTIERCPALTDLDALAGVRGSPVVIQLLRSSGLVSIAGLGGLWDAGDLSGDTLILHDLPQLASLTGLEALPAAGTLELSALPQLDSLAPLAGLRAVDELRLNDLPALNSLAGLTSLERVGTLQIGRCEPASGLPLVDLAGLGAVTELHAIHLDDNLALQSLADLDALVTGPDEVIAVDNPSLDPDAFAAFVAAHDVPTSCQEPPGTCSCDWSDVVP